MAKQMSCESCPYLPIEWGDVAAWKERHEALASPELSDATNEHARDVEREIRKGMDEARPWCPGYTWGKLLGGMLRDTLRGRGGIANSESDLRFVTAAERVCNNPFLETQEYAALADSLTGYAIRHYEADISAASATEEI